MTQATCAIDGCERAVRTRGMCQSHYNKWRWQRSKESTVQCSVKECTQPVWAKELCGGHYQRKRNTGYVGSSQLRVVDPVYTCKFEGCDNPHDSNGLCGGHRWQQKQGRELTSLLNQVALTDRDDQGRKYCGACCDWFPEDQFGKSQANADGLAHKCRRCTRNANLQSNFGMTVDEYEALHLAQGGKCAICGGHENNGRALAVDHDHSCCSGKRKNCGRCTRALLCQRCNQGVGYFRDSPEFLRAAADYIEKYRGELP